MTDTTTPVTTAFAAAARQMLARHPGDEEGRMLRSPGLRSGGKFYGFVTGADVIVKLPADRVSELVASGTGEPCATRPGRPMREWVRILAPDEAACLAYLEEARAFVAG